MTTKLHQHQCTLLETWVSWEVFKKLGEKRQPLPAAAKAWFMPRQVLSKSGLSARGCLCLLQSSRSSAARLRPAHPFSHGVQKPALVWFGYSRGQDSSCIAHRLPTRPLNTFLPSLNRSNLSPLTLVGKTKPYLYSVGKIALIQTGYIHWEVYSAELRARNETGKDLFIRLTNIENLLCVRDVVGTVGTKVRKLYKWVKAEHRKQNCLQPLRSQ